MTTNTIITVKTSTQAQSDALSTINIQLLFPGVSPSNRCVKQARAPVFSAVHALFDVKSFLHQGVR